MKRLERTIPILLMLTILLCSCSKSQEEQWQEQYDLGVRYLSEGNYEEAIIAFTAAIEIDPKRAEAYVGRGDAYIGSGETEENRSLALADYQYALELDSTQADIYLRIAECNIAFGDISAAIEILNIGIAETNDEMLRLKLQECEDMLRSDEITVLIKQSYIMLNYIADGEYGDERNYSEKNCTYEYNRDGYMVHAESWYCDHAPWHSESGQWILTISDDWTYDTESDKWIHSGYRRYGGDLDPEPLDHYDIGTYAYYTTEANGNVCVTCDPYPVGSPEIVYNSEYNAEEFYNFDWYSAKYTYDTVGNAVRIESYGIDGALLGICELEYEVLQLK